MIYLALILAYFIFVWVVLRLAVPYLGFSRAPIPVDLPEEMEKAIIEMNAQSQSDLDYAQRAYAFVTA